MAVNVDRTGEKDLDRERAGDGRCVMRRRARLLVLLASTALAALLLPAAPAFASCPANNGDTYSTAVLADSPVAYYRLDEPVGTTMCDYSSSHNNGTYNGSGITYGVTGALKGDSDTAVAANGTSGVIGNSNSNSPISGDDSFTLEGWFRSTGTTQNQVLVHVGSSSLANGTAAGVATWDSTHGDSAPSKLALDEFNAANIWDTTPHGINLFDGSWHYLAVTYDSTSNMVTGYVDGQDLGAQTASADFNAPNPGSFNISSSPIGVGNWVDTVVNKPFIGDADEVAVYTKVLSASRIAAHFQAAGGTTSSGQSTTTSVGCNYEFTGPAAFSDICTATVGSGTPHIPTGHVSFASSSGGSFPAGTQCTLAPSSGVASCSVQFIPPASASTTIRANYLGDSQDKPSSGSTGQLLPQNTARVISSASIAPLAIVAAPSGSPCAGLAPGISCIARAHKFGGTVKFAARAPALVVFTVQRPVPGRKGRGGRCVKPTGKNLKHGKCTRWVSLHGHFKIKVTKAGSYSFLFRGRIGGKTLKPGRYRLVATPHIAGVRELPAFIRFRVK